MQARTYTIPPTLKYRLSRIFERLTGDLVIPREELHLVHERVSTPERKYIGGRSKNASRTDARRAAPDARPRPGRVTPSSALQFDQ